MLTIDKLVEDLQAALCPGSSCQESVDKVCEILKHYSSHDMKLPERLCQTEGPCYARHLIHKQSDDGFCVVAMVWGPGQGTQVHDHGGTWCVEGCVQGQLAITSYRMTDQVDATRVRFEQEDYLEVGRGAVGSLIPPFEHHKIHNPFGEVAITLHVYGKELRNCTRFLKDGEDTYIIERVPLSYSSLPSLC